jgi:hypothetical protein
MKGAGPSPENRYMVDVLGAWEANDAPKIIMSEMPRPKNDFLRCMFWHWQKIHRRC